MGERNGESVLSDPFNDEVFRTLTQDETATVGDSPYVMESFGELSKRPMPTFGDGPDATFTPEILNVLSAEGVPAIFFNIDTKVVAQPELFRRIIHKSHMVGNHTMTHTTVWDDALRSREELISTDRAMRSVRNYATSLFRLPTGDPNNKPLPILEAQQLGYLHVDFHLDTQDCAAATGDTVRLPELDGTGHIMLIHNGGGDRTATVTALKGLIHQAKSEGNSFSVLAPVVPEKYRTVADGVTALAIAGLMVAPDVVMVWLFWFGIGSLTLISAPYVVLATIGYHRQKHRVWQRIPEQDLPLVSMVLSVFNEESVIARTQAPLAPSDCPPS